eukprot:m.109292 g.109292  ORF g.109292 m.109292 type:complete len:490 (+) comp15970_c0_seq1:177-1646(+)
MRAKTTQLELVALLGWLTLAHASNERPQLSASAECGTLSSAGQLCHTGQGVLYVNVSQTSVHGLDKYSLDLKDGNDTKLFSFVVEGTPNDAVSLFNYTSGAARQLQNARLESIHKNKPWIPVDLVDFNPSASRLWISIDQKNGIISLGFGYPVFENIILQHIFPVPLHATACPPADPSLDGYCALRSVKQLTSDEPVQLLPSTKFPVVKHLPPALVHSDDNTLELLSSNKVIVPANLPLEAQELAATVAGRSVLLDATDAKAIDHALKTPGNELHDRLEEKRAQSEFGDPNMVYLRATIGPDLGNSPGSPYVVEIWPPGCYSPVHDHANTVAVIKVLSGKITSRFYNPLENHNNHVELVPFATNYFQVGNITYISPRAYQTHQLHNEGEFTCVTIQSYFYLDGDMVHYETFDYANPNEEYIQHFKPDSDFQFSELIKIAREAYHPPFPSKNSGLSDGAIAGVAVGVVCVVAVVIGVIVYFKRSATYRSL